MKKIIQFILAIMIAVPLFGQTVKLNDVQDAVPGTVNVSLTLSDFSEPVGAITLYIQYDLDLLTYTGPAFFILDDIEGSFSATVGPNENWLALGWNNPEGSDFNNPANIDLQFNYTGAFVADLHFVSHMCEIVPADEPMSPFSLDLQDGKIIPKVIDQVGTISLGEESDKLAGAPVSIPLEFSAFSSDAYTANLYIGFDSNLAYVGTSDNIGGFNVSFDDGIINLARAITGEAIEEGEVIKLNFTYLGAGDANIYFLPGSVAGDLSGDPLHVIFEGGKVTQSNVFVSTFEIARVITPGAVLVEEFETIGISPAEEYVAVTNSTELNQVGALNLRIAYDNEKLEFKTLIAGSPSSGWAFTNNPGTGIIEVSREVSTAGYTLPAGDLFTLKFDYLVVPPDPPDPTFLGIADIVFDGFNMVGDNLGNIFNIEFVDGWIAMVVPGNANCNPDGIVNILDVLAILAYMADPTYTPFCFMNADVAEPFGVINILDVLEVLNIMAE